MDIETHRKGIMSWIDDLLRQINFEKFYPKGKQVGRNQILIHCVFHDDKKESLSINTYNGLYYCHACGAKGNFLSWCKENNIDLEVIAKSLGIEVRKEKSINEKEVQLCHEELLKTPRAIDWLNKTRGINLDTISKFQIGAKDKRFTIPIRDINGKLANIRLYDRNGKGQAKMISWGSGYGSARLFPVYNIYEKEILLCEGEMDTILACQLGFHAITGTTGASTFKTEWAKYFTGKKVNICYDIDSAGKQGAQKVAKLLADYAEEVRIINLPINPAEIPNGDFTDFIVNLGNSVAAMKELILASPTWKKPKEEQEIIFHPVTLSEANNSKYNEKFIKMSALVAGKDIESFIVPKKVKAICTISAGKMCNICPLSALNGEHEFGINETNQDLLMMTNCTNRFKESVLKNIIGIPAKCGVVILNEIENYNIEEIILTPEVEYTTNVTYDNKFVIRNAYYLGHNIETNRPYNFSAKTIAHPKTQYATHLIFEAEPALTSIESFEFTDEKHERLKSIFKKDDLMENLINIYNNTIMPISTIKGRLDLFISTLLTYCSPLHFEFENKVVTKGWIETLVLGDTRTGKSALLGSLIEFFQAGEMVQGESASFAGLVGGLQQVGNRWHLNWGRIPLNNGRLIVVDEMSGLNIYDIGKLSGIRSSGIAEITKIRTERTWAKTRIIWLSNPRGTREQNQRMLSSYGQGVKAVPELIGRSEDISRFDLVLLISMDEVSSELINSHNQTEIKREYNSQDFHDLIMWCWKLKHPDIKFDQGVVKFIYDVTDKFSKKYSQNIPLVVPNEQRIKIAKIAVAAAAMNYNTSDGKKLLVEEHHVRFAEKFLFSILDKPACGYDEFSRLEKSRSEMLNKDQIEKVIANYPDCIDQLLDIDRFSQIDIQEIFNIETRSSARETINMLIRAKCLKRIIGGYEKTTAFIKYLRSIDKVKLKKKEEETQTNWIEEPPF